MRGKEILERLRADRNLGSRLSIEDLGDEWASISVLDIVHHEHEIPADAVRTILQAIPTLSRHQKIPITFTTSDRPITTLRVTSCSKGSTRLAEQPLSVAAPMRTIRVESCLQPTAEPGHEPGQRQRALLVTKAPH